MASTEQFPSFETPLFEVPVLKPVTGSFCSFTKLPVELRRLVWTSYLQRQRIITLQLTRRTEPFDPPYMVETKRLYRHSTLLFVNREARRAAQEFFSLRIPCDNTTAPLYCSPAFDTIFIHQGRHQGLEFIADFLPKLAKHDSRGVGVLNLAIDRVALEDLERTRSEGSRFAKAPVIDQLDTPALRAFTDAICRLHSLWIVYIESAKTRQMGALDFVRAGVHHNRSVPVFPEVQTFQRLPADSRPIETDLRYVGTRHSPRWAIDTWRELEAQLQVVRKTPLEFRVMLTVDSNRQIVDRSTAQNYFKEDERQFREECCRRFNLNLPPWGHCLDREEWEDLRGRLQDVVGFWLFTPTAFDESSYGWDIVRDLTRHPPELCVSDLGD
ncbi:hypothetical protein PG993_012588 [Apiospora rasikravindrae]|uniref:2EXR domain-containing protein n=1 Tax=Apiospora rasikravindrae TaxID=990691 RepID=A0ABR1S2T3_9PEZI